MNKVNYIIVSKSGEEIPLSLAAKRKDSLKLVGCTGPKDWLELKKKGFSLKKITQ